MNNEGVIANYIGTDKLTPEAFASRVQDSMFGKIIKGDELESLQTFGSDEYATEIRSAVCDAINSQSECSMELDPDIDEYEDQNEEGLIYLYYGIRLYGGENGRGLWSNYTAGLNKVFEFLESTFQDVWMISLDIDTLDDVWETYIGVII